MNQQNGLSKKNNDGKHRASEEKKARASCGEHSDD